MGSTTELFGKAGYKLHSKAVAACGYIEFTRKTDAPVLDLQTVLIAINPLSVKPTPHLRDRHTCKRL